MVTMYALLMILSAKDVSVPMRIPGMTMQQCKDEMKYAKAIAVKAKVTISAQCQPYAAAPSSSHEEHEGPVGPDGKMHNKEGISY